jgi:uncharacterized protein YkwD
MEPEVPQPSSRDTMAASRKRKARRRLIFITLAVIIIGAAGWRFQKSFSLAFQNIVPFENSVSTQIGKAFSFSAPPPLQQVSRTGAKKVNTLTVAGVITQTNFQRQTNGNFSVLSENATLDDIATLRIDDMFQQQYFAHVNSSTGESAETVASSVGYSYLALGENLALGNYAGDAGVVTAWMNSSGHRANILNTHYTQIGVAVREGTFQGQTTWIAVQVFGKPASDCSQPDMNLKKSIDLSEAQISTMNGELRSQKDDIDSMSPQSGPAYNEKVSEYNTLAAQYNNLTAQTKNAIDMYNTGVKAFNACLGQ